MSRPLSLMILASLLAGPAAAAEGTQWRVAWAGFGEGDYTRQQLRPADLRVGRRFITERVPVARPPDLETLVPPDALLALRRCAGAPVCPVPQPLVAFDAILVGVAHRDGRREVALLHVYGPDGVLRGSSTPISARTLLDLYPRLETFDSPGFVSTHIQKVIAPLPSATLPILAVAGGIAALGAGSFLALSAATANDDLRTGRIRTGAEAFDTARTAAAQQAGGIALLAVGAVGSAVASWWLVQTVTVPPPDWRLVPVPLEGGAALTVSGVLR